jgi:hypothetical protein
MNEGVIVCCAADADAGGRWSENMNVGREIEPVVAQTGGA